LQADPMHREAFFELAALWDQLDVLSELSELFPLDQSTAVAKRSTFAKWNIAAMAAGAASVVALGWILVERYGSPAVVVDERVVEALTEDFATTIGGQVSERLPDGSVVSLNTDTEVTVVYSATARDVFLRRGEANFEVAHAADHPFRVHVGARIVEATGTAFNVQLRPSGEIEVTVTDGSVKVLRAGVVPTVPTPPSIEARMDSDLDTSLVAGQVALLGEATALGQGSPQIARLQPVDLDIKLAWQRGMLVFQGEPLQEMLAEVGRYTTAQFVLADEELGNVRVGGYLRS
jgi:transmembrane sensor